MTYPTQSPQNGASPQLTFPQWLASREEDELLRIFRLRPDIIVPPPPTLSSLATRMRLRTSVARAATQLTGAELAIVTTAARLGAESHSIPAELLAAQPAELSRLADLGLLYPTSPNKLRLIPELMAVLPAEFQDLRPISLNNEEIRTRLAALNPRERAVLDTLARSGLVGTTKDAAPEAAPERPVPRLIAQELLRRVDENTVRLPLAVWSTLSGRELPVLTVAPELPTTAANTDPDTAGLAAGLDLVRRIAALLDALGTQPAAVLRTGGVGIREINRLAKALGESPEDLVTITSVALAAGLLAIGEPSPLPVGAEDHNFLAPTPQADDWELSSLTVRWVDLLAGWLGSLWAPWETVACLGKSGVNLFGEDNRHDRLPAERTMILSCFATFPGVAFSVAQIHAQLSYQSPLLLLRQHPETLAQIVSEAELLGALAGGQVTSALRALLAGQETAVVAAEVEKIAPPTVEQVIIQADLTILAPGPLPPALAAELALLADIESPGLAAVYRLSETSLRRALDAGRSAADLTSFLSHHALGELPQTVLFLITETARYHGSLRGGLATCYLRCDDEKTLATAVQTTAATSGLRLLAPTVAVSSQPLAVVITSLQQAGFHPAAEDAAGLSIDLRRAPARVPARPRRGPLRRTPDPEQLRHTARTLLHTLQVAQSDSAEQPTAIAEGLIAAARSSRWVRLEILDKQSRPQTLVLRPLRVAAGRLDAQEKSGAGRRIALSRISRWELV